jgi:hypothetical protein
MYDYLSKAFDISSMDEVTYDLGLYMLRGIPLFIDDIAES